MSSYVVGPYLHHIAVFRWKRAAVVSLALRLMTVPTDSSSSHHSRSLSRDCSYRAHGRINAYMSNPAHIEIILGEKPAGALPCFVCKLSVRRRVAG